MKPRPQSVPFGYEPPKEIKKGTLFFYDTFEETGRQELEQALRHANLHGFADLVLYPIHEETARRMTKDPVSALYKRRERLEEWIEDSGHEGEVILENWETRRKKYTPIDLALRHLTELYKGPHFLYLTPETANLFASYASFDDWISNIRMVVSADDQPLHPKLEKHRSRWDFAVQ